MTKHSGTSLNRRELIAAGASAAVPVALRTPVAATGGQQASASLQAQGIAVGHALVTSVRSPLYGIGPGQIGELLDGTITDWRDVGCPFSLGVERFGMDGYANDGFTPTEVLAD